MIWLHIISHCWKQRKKILSEEKTFSWAHILYSRLHARGKKLFSQILFKLCINQCDYTLWLHIDYRYFVWTKMHLQMVCFHFWNVVNFNSSFIPPTMLVTYNERKWFCLYVWLFTVFISCGNTLSLYWHFVSHHIRFRSPLPHIENIVGSFFPCYILNMLHANLLLLVSCFTRACYFPDFYPALWSFLLKVLCPAFLPPPCMSSSSRSSMFEECYI